MRVLIRAKAVIPMDRKGRVIREGAVLIEDGKISSVGPREEVRVPGAKDDLVIDEPYGVVIPGLIDLHVHLAHALITGVVPDDVTLIPWLRTGSGGFRASTTPGR
jgi:Cytosine deaminase and related metal-dependent hydrolases